MTQFERYAVYFTPKQGTELADFGNNWLSADSPQESYVQSPLRYGFHATLKAPMRLKPGCAYSDLEKAVKTLCQSLETVELGILRLQKLGTFLALLTDGIHHPAVSKLAFECVSQLDFLRAPINEIDREKRGALTGDLKANFEKWGYPYVGDAFKFHMTLTSSLEDKEQEEAWELLHDRIPSEPTIIDAVSILGDPGNSKPFELVDRFALKA